MTLPDPFARLVLQESSDPYEVSAMADLLASRITSRTQTLTGTPRVAPPAEWVASRQKGPVALAAWAAQHCDDAPTLWAIASTKRLRQGVLDALCENTHLPRGLRESLAGQVQSVGYRLRELRESTPFDQRLAAFTDTTTQLAIRHAQGTPIHTRSTTTEAEDLARHTECTPVQMLDICRALMSVGEADRAAQFLGDARTTAPTLARPILDIILPAFNWNLPIPDDTEARLVDVDALRRYGVDVTSSSDLPTPPVALCDTLLRNRLPLTEREYAQLVAAHTLLTRSSSLDHIHTRDDLRIQLAVIASPEMGYRSAAALNVIEGSHDPLIIELLAFLNQFTVREFLQGEWYLGGDEEGQRILPTEAHVAYLFRPDTRDASARSTWSTGAVGAITNDDLPEEYRHMLLLHTPGAAARVLNKAQARRWVWETLRAATSRMDLAIDQLATSPEISLIDLCAVLTKLERATARSATPRIHAPIPDPTEFAKPATPAPAPEDG